MVKILQIHQNVHFFFAGARILTCYANNNGMTRILIKVAVQIPMEMWLLMHSNPKMIKSSSRCAVRVILINPLRL